MTKPLDILYYIHYHTTMVNRRNGPKKGITPNTSIRIDPDVLHQARIAAVTQRKTLGHWLEEAIMDKLEKIEKAKRKGS